ncbi:MAG: sigma-54 dependent transcriptional regulator [Bacteroidaceae bacterium]|nr:sigma-54 dependent transcriptional regulator [Bacteroidaceae bacterium]
MNESNLQAIKQRYGIVGNAPELNRALDIAVQVAPTDLSVLIQGESGVGKEVVPKIIHDKSARKHQKYFAINCGSIPEGTIDSELFGHEKGAFTGAIGEREGYFGAANKGTLFLDEVGELPLSTQARLLRVLETGEYIRVGSSEVKKTDVRIIAATNVNIQKAISEGKFREDLYYRLATIPINIPPLRARGKDIELLFRKFSSSFAERYMLDPIVLSDDAKMLLQSYKWPGNIRQLKNIAEQICIISQERNITAEALIQFGITDDSNTGRGLVLANQASPGQHTYENEREWLVHALTSLGKEVKELKEMINNQQTIHQQPTHILQDAEYSVAPQYDPAPVTHINLPSESIQNAVEYVEPTPRSMKEVEEMQIKEALQRNHFNRSRTAKELGISERTLYRRIKDYGLEKE